LSAAALALACVTAKTATVPPAPPEPARAATTAPAPAPAPTPVAVAPFAAPDGGTASAPKPRCGPPGMELVTRGQGLQRDKGEDGAEEAIALYRQALAGDPGCAEALWELGWSLQIKGDPAAAVEAWDQLKKIDPDYPGMA